MQLNHDCKSDITLGAAAQNIFPKYFLKNSMTTSN